MNLGEQIRTKLLGASAVAQFVGNRAYMNVAPQGAAFPRVVVTVVSAVPESTLTGTVAETAHGSRVQVDCYAERYLDAVALAEAVDDALDALDEPDLNATKLMARESFEDDSAPPVHRVSTDFGFWR